MMAEAIIIIIVITKATVCVCVCAVVHSTSQVMLRMHSAPHKSIENASQVTDQLMTKTPK